MSTGINKRAYRIALARHRLQRKIERNPTHRNVEKWKEHVQQFFTRSQESIPPRLQKKFPNWIKTAAVRVKDVQTLYDLYTEMRPQLAVSSRPDYYKALEQFKSEAAKKITRSRLRLTLRLFREMGFIPAHGKETQFYSGHFKSEAEAVACIEKNRKIIFSGFRSMGLKPKLMQDVFDEMGPFILKRLMEFVPKTNLDIYLFYSAKQAVLKYFEKRRTKNIRSRRPSLVERNYSFLPPNLHNIVSLVGEKTLKKILLKLDPNYRAVIELRFQGMSFAQINEKLGLSANAVRWRSWRALTQIRNAINEATRKA